MTNVFPWTSNGRVASPELVTGGAAIPPRAEVLETAVEVPDALAAELVPVAWEMAAEVLSELSAELVATASSTTTVLVERGPQEVVAGDEAATMATWVCSGGSTKTVEVVSEHTLSVSTESPDPLDPLEPLESPVAAATELVTTAATELVEVNVVAIVVSERIEPVTVAVGGTVTVAVIVVGLALDDCDDAADPQDSFWLVHSSREKPAPVREVQVVNCCSQAEPQARVISSNNSSKTRNWFPCLETDGGRPPRERVNSKNVSMTVTFWTTVVDMTWTAEVVLEPDRKSVV